MISLICRFLLTFSLIFSMPCPAAFATEGSDSINEIALQHSEALSSNPSSNGTTAAEEFNQVDAPNSQQPSNLPDSTDTAPTLLDANSEPASQPVSSLSVSYDAPSSQPAFSAESPVTSAKVESLTNEILRNEIELMMLNTKFRIATTDKGRAKPWRVFLANLAASGVATAGITTIAAERWRTWQRPATANRRALKAGPIMLLTSHSIITGSILCEAMLDAIKDCKQRKNGLDAASTQKKALELCTLIDTKLSERDALAGRLRGSLSAEDLRMITQEGLLLRDLRNLSLGEYAQFHVRAKKRIAARNASYLNGLSAASTGGYLGSLCGLIAVCARKPRIAGPAGIGFTISGFNIATAPIVGRVSGNWAARRAKIRLSRELPKVEPANLQEHAATLKSLVSPQDENILARLSVYETADAIFKQQAKMNAAEKNKGDKEFRERLVWNSAVGGTKMAWGIQLMNAGFGFHPAPPAPKATNARARALLAELSKRKKTPAQLFSKRVAQGATSYIPGTGLWILDTLQARLRGELDIYNLGQTQSLPHQKLSDRQSKIESMQNTMKGISE